jgi:large subunit ribosomal protein L23
MNIKDIIKRPIITEKSGSQPGEGIYSFEVSLKADKTQVKTAIEKIFKVTVIKVRTIVVKGKTRRVPKTRKAIQQENWKKAIVQLKAGQKIDLFETGE